MLKYTQNLQLTNTGTAVGVACDPGAMDGEHHEQHQDGHHHNTPQVHAQAVTATLTLKRIAN